MNKETLEALEKSIEHWEENVSLAEDKNPINASYTSCALCSLFYRHAAEVSCIGCPVFNKTGKRYCQGTPYNKASHGNLEGCREEVEFLKSLLPRKRV